MAGKRHYLFGNHANGWYRSKLLFSRLSHCDGPQPAAVILAGGAFDFGIVFLLGWPASTSQQKVAGFNGDGQYFKLKLTGAGLNFRYLYGAAYSDTLKETIAMGIRSEPSSHLATHLAAIAGTGQLGTPL